MYRQTDFMGTGADACFYQFNVLVFSHFSLGNETQKLIGCSKQQPYFSLALVFINWSECMSDCTCNS